MTLTNSIVSKNSVRADVSGNIIIGGGGIAAFIRDVTITNSTIIGNLAYGPNATGGGIYASSGTITINKSTISGNSAGDSGGGVWAKNTPSVTNSTISGNSANNNGGGIYVELGDETGVISYSTISDNASDTDLNGAGAGGGLFVRSGTLSVDHTIVAQNTDHSSVGPDLTGFLGVVLDVHFSLIGDNTGSGLTEAPVGAPDSDGNVIGNPTGGGIIDPLLGPLTDNGGPTQTHALLPGSPAINAGDPVLQQGDPGLPEFDQRGAPFGRVVGNRIDIGAFESQSAIGSLNGDFDSDGDTDGFDFLTWQRGFGITVGATLSDGDATADHDVDNNDRDVWQATFGVSPPPFALSLAPTPLAPAKPFPTFSFFLSQSKFNSPQFDTPKVLATLAPTAKNTAYPIDHIFRDLSFADPKHDIRENAFPATNTTNTDQTETTSTDEAFAQLAEELLTAQLAI